MLTTAVRQYCFTPWRKRPLEAEFRRSKGQKVSIRTIDLFQEWKGVSRDMLLLVS